ncbi:hypothetical protein AB0M46_49105 [Dactylosporangium sp. NPDC051485]|uniref:hypothetical protein n=1 Tax=Dactylosporangium sp. NPDC051485 TaxID=3154846 RepID=UPI00341CDB80
MNPDDEQIDAVVRPVALAVAAAAPRPPGAAPMTAAQLIGIAVRRRRVRRQRRQLLAAAATFATVLIIAGAGVVGFPEAQQSAGLPGPDACVAAAVPVTAPAPLRPGPAAPALAQLATLSGYVSTLTDGSEVRHPTGSAAAGTGYAFLHLRRWAVQPGAATAAIHDEQLWWDPTRPGLRRSCSVAAFTATGTLDTASAAAIPAGGAGAAITDPSADPAVLAAQLADSGPAPDGAHVFLERIADLYSSHVLTPAQRGAALRILADTPGVQVRGQLADRTGRIGTAVSATAIIGGVTVEDVAVFDGSGQLLTHEQTRAEPGAATATVSTVLLILAAARTPAPAMTP